MRPRSESGLNLVTLGRGKSAATSDTGPQPSPPPRLIWVDSARGACVIAVVLFHVCLKQYLPMSADVWHPAIRAWGAVNNYLSSLRMPLLMAISGMLASRRIKQGWGHPGAAVRAVSSYYLYAVWLAVYFLVYLLVGGPNLVERMGYLPAFLLQLVAPETPLWFIFALAVYMVLFTSIRRLPAGIVLSALALVSFTIATMHINWDQLEKVPAYALFFAVGVYGGSQLEAFAERRKVADLLASAALGVTLIAIGHWHFGAAVDAILLVLRQLALIALGAAVVVNLIRWSPLAWLGQFIGRRTLQIYVLHIPLILIVIDELTEDRVRSMHPLLQNPVVAMLWPLVMTVLVIGLSLLIRWLLAYARLDVAFRIPAPWIRWIERRYLKDPVESGKTRPAAIPVLALAGHITAPQEPAMTGSTTSTRARRLPPLPEPADARTGSGRVRRGGMSFPRSGARPSPIRFSSPD